MELGGDAFTSTEPVWMTDDIWKTVPFTQLKRYTLKPESQQKGELVA